MNNKFIEFLKEFHYSMRNIAPEKDFEIWLDKMEAETWMKHCLAFYTLEITKTK